MSLSKPAATSGPATVVEGVAGVATDAVKHAWWTAASWVQALRRAGFRRGFLTGYVAKALMTLLPKLIRARGNVFKIAPFIAHILGPRGDAWRYGVFFGGMNVLFRSGLRWAEQLKVDPLPLTLSEHMLQFIQTHRVALSGALSALALFAIPEADRTYISLFFFVHALDLSARWLVQHKYLPYFCHGDVALMAVASMQIIWAWFHSRDSHDRSYLHFLDLFGGHPWPVMRGFKAVLNNHDRTMWAAHPDIVSLNEWRAQKGIHPVKLAGVGHYCDLLHPHTDSCMVEAKRYYLWLLGMSAKIYGGVYTLPLLLFRFKDLLRRPVPVLTSTLTSILRSSIFLSTYCFNGWASGCLFRDVEWSSQISCLGKGFVSGCTLFIERKSRRIELALYVLSHALRSTWRTGVAWGWWPNVPHGQVLILALAMSALLSAHIRSNCGPPRADGPLLRANETKFFRFFFGVPNFSDKPYSSSVRWGLHPSQSAAKLRALLTEQQRAAHVKAAADEIAAAAAATANEQAASRAASPVAAPAPAPAIPAADEIVVSPAAHLAHSTAAAAAAPLPRPVTPSVQR